MSGSAEPPGEEVAASAGRLSAPSRTRIRSDAIEQAPEQQPSGVLGRDGPAVHHIRVLLLRGPQDGQPHAPGTAVLTLALLQERPRGGQRLSEPAEALLGKAQPARVAVVEE